MSDRNPEYDFKWCPGCGDFGVRRALGQAMKPNRLTPQLQGILRRW